MITVLACIGAVTVYLVIGHAIGWFVDNYRDPVGHGFGAVFMPLFWPLLMWFFIRCYCGKWHIGKRGSLFQ